MKKCENKLSYFWYPAVTYAAFQHQGRLFWITCKRPKLLRKAGRLQLIQNSTPSVALMRQCCIRIQEIYNFLWRLIVDIVFFFVIVTNLKLFSQFSKLRQIKNKFHILNLYKTCKSAENQSPNFGLNRETIVLSRILTAVCTWSYYVYGLI